MPSRGVACSSFCLPSGGLLSFSRVYVFLSGNWFRLSTGQDTPHLLAYMGFAKEFFNTLIKCAKQFVNKYPFGECSGGQYHRISSLLIPIQPVRTDKNEFSKRFPFGRYVGRSFIYRKGGLPSWLSSSRKKLLPSKSPD